MRYHSLQMNPLASLLSRLLPWVLFPLAPSLVMALSAVPLMPQGEASQGAEPSPCPDILLITLDTTRADALGSYGGAPTPHLDAAATGGTRYERAITASPLTLPAHASLFTGLTPPEHGIHDNGIASLGPNTPTVAKVLSARGYTTGAVVGSRVLDGRFGLSGGFDHYDDRMAAEHRGEYGYPERTAASVTDAAIQWLAGLKNRESPTFLWVHYYDPHAPYSAPDTVGASEDERYRDEIRYVDQQVGRLLRALSDRPWILAIVGDHGESLGAHGERAHGLLLHEPTLRVPLILKGPGVPAGTTVAETVASRRLAPTILKLAGSKDDGEPDLGRPLPGLHASDPSRTSREPDSAATYPPVYSETHLPYTAYGWSVVESLTEERLRFVVGARGELFDVTSDPGEDQDLIDTHRREARRLQRELARRHEGFAQRAVATAPQDPETRAALRSLGYLSGTSGRGVGHPDPTRFDAKAGLALLDDLEHAKQILAQGQTGPALEILQDLGHRNPENVPLLSTLARAQLAHAIATDGDTSTGLATYQRALTLNPNLEFLHLALAQAYHRLGRIQPAIEAYEATLTLDPRNAEAALALAEIAANAGDRKTERLRLETAVTSGTASASILVRLAQLDLQLGTAESIIRAGDSLRQATSLTPEWPLPWLLLGRWELDHGAPATGREALQRVLRLAPGSPQAEQASRWLQP